MLVGARQALVALALAPTAFGAETPALTRIAGTYDVLPEGSEQLLAALDPAAAGDWVTFVGERFNQEVGASLFRWSPATGIEQVFNSNDLGAYGFDQPPELVLIRDHTVEADGRVLMALDVVPGGVTQEVAGLWLWAEGHVVELLRTGQSIQGFDGEVVLAGAVSFLPSGDAAALIVTEEEQAVGFWADGAWTKLDSTGILYQGDPAPAQYYAQIPGLEVAQVAGELFRRPLAAPAWEHWPGPCCAAGPARPLAGGFAVTAWSGILGDVADEVYFYPATLAEPELLIDIADVPASTLGPALAFGALSGAGARLAMTVGYPTPGVVLRDADGDLIPIARPGDVLNGESFVGDAEVKLRGMAEHRLAFFAATSTGFEVWIADFPEGNPIAVPTLGPLGIAALAAGFALAGLRTVGAREKRTAGSRA
jgi:hypothetical protein